MNFSDSGRSSLKVNRNLRTKRRDFRPTTLPTPRPPGELSEAEQRHIADYEAREAERARRDGESLRLALVICAILGLLLIYLWTIY